MRICVLVLACFGVACLVAAEETVIPLDPLTMVDPRTGHSVTGAGGDGGTAWRQSNAVWDGARIALQGARGETLTVQLVFAFAPERPIDGIKLELDAPPVRTVRAWRAWCIWNTPEIAVPLKENVTFDLPSKLALEAELFAKEKYAFWSAGIDFDIPRDAKPGKLAGKLRVTAKAGLPERVFPVEIQVLPCDLPARPSLLVEMNSYGDYDKFLGRGAESYVKIQRMMREHRCSFTQVPYMQSGQLGAEFLAPKVAKDAAGALAFDWSAFDAALGGVLDGSAFDDKTPVSHFILPLCYNWPVAFSAYSRQPDEYKAQNLLARKLIARHIREKNWTQTAFHEFHNENPSAGAKCPWHLDEPRSARDLDGHVLFSGLLDEAVKAEAGTKLQYRIDVSDWRRLGDAFGKLAPNIQVWSVSRDRKYLNRDSAGMFRKFADAKGGTFIEYGEVAGFSVDGKAVNWSRFGEYARNCWELGLDGYAQWMIDMWKCKQEQKPTVPLFYSNAAGARDLIWPGNHFGSVEPLPSLRLKAIRESLNLSDYAALALKKLPARKDEIRALMAGLALDSAQGHYQAKTKLAKLLAE